MSLTAANTSVGEVEANATAAGTVGVGASVGINVGRNVTEAAGGEEAQRPA